MQGIRKHIRSNLVAYVALVVALSGTASAIDGPLPGRNKVGSSDIIDEEVKARDINGGAVKTSKLGIDAVTTEKVLDGTLIGGDLADGSISGADVADGSISGADVGNKSLSGEDVADNSLGGGQISEDSLGRVPSATLGGYGRWAQQGGLCDPTSTNFLTCAFVTLNLPSQARVLVNGAIRADAVGSGDGIGDCLLATSSGVIAGTEMRVVASSDNIEFVPITAVTGVLPAGPTDFGIECNEISGTIRYSEMMVSAVALSPN
jgi:hypothetical protein